MSSLMRREKKVGDKENTIKQRRFEEGYKGMEAVDKQDQDC